MLQRSGVWNLRDVGGLTAPDGASLRTGRFWRSGQLSWLDDTGRQMLRDIAISDVADLRSPHEVERYGPDQVPDGVVVHNLPFPDIDGATGEAPHEHAYRRMVREDISAGEVPAAEKRYMIEEYRRFPTLRGAQRAVRRLITLLADDRPVITHCFAGKDRTGFTVAVVLEALGVDWDTILDDYLRSNDAVPQLRALMLEMLTSSNDLPPDALDAARTRLSDNVLGVRPEYLTAARESIGNNFGTIDDYLRAAGVDAATVAALRNSVLT